MVEAVIELKQVSKHFGSQQVLKNVNLHVPEKSVFAFLGNNGAGKSTTIRLITGLLQPDHGEVFVLGKDIRHHRREISGQIGCLVDSPCLYPNLTATEFLRIGCTIKQLAPGEIGRVLEVVNLRETGNKIAHFSLGMKQRLALAHAMLGKPRLLILDEPGNGLDPQGILEIRNLLLELPVRANCTVFMSSHQLDEVEKIASHIALLKDGAVLCQASVAELVAEQMGVLALEIGDANHGLQLLKSLNYDARITGESTLEVHRIQLQHADQLHASLISAGVRLFQSVYQKPSLEEWFLSASANKV